MKKRLFRVILINVFLLLILLAYLLIRMPMDISTSCIFRLVTGYKCPGCGITHYIYHIINLDFGNAFMDNPLVFFLSPLLLVYYVIYNYCYIRYNNTKMVVIPNYISYTLIIISILFGIFRNIWNI